MRWRQEIEELHDFFENYFRGTESSLERVEEALAPGFSIVGPDADESDRDQTLTALRVGQGRATDLRITTRDHRLILEDGNTVVAAYVEQHDSPSGQTLRRSTVVFVVDVEGPNGLRWLRVHETWM